ncbi:MAG TPA: HEAT repeat domain-containing protein [Pyrinomonadaceae bacterium]|nr:HEAT repeat domain-containing protein [Pyrinomonadaceae bacterium]
MKRARLADDLRMMGHKGDRPNVFRHGPRRATLARGPALLFALALPCAFTHALPGAQSAQVARGASLITQGELTPLQHEIRVQTTRLSSTDVEERRDAVVRLGAMSRPEGSRAAAAALGDAAPIVRATAARAVLALPSGEAGTLILPLLSDRDEFVRREAAYALGLARSGIAVDALVAAVETDKQASVRGAAAVALGQIGDARAVRALAGALARRLSTSADSKPNSGGSKSGSNNSKRAGRRKVEQDEFVRRAAAVSLGQIGSGEAVPALVETLSDERAPGDVRREAARSLGLIGDPAAAPALRQVLTNQDPYLSRIAFEALRKLEPSASVPPGGGSL